MKIKNFMKNFKQWIIIWLWIIFILSSFGIVYAVWDSYDDDVNTWDSLTAEKRNTLKDEVVSMQDSLIPSWIVSAFSWTSCPTWWSEYTLAYGRFIRWIDKSWTSIDPDGERSVWDTQDDMFENHTHSTYHPWSQNAAKRINDRINIASDIQANVNIPTWGTETRPKNVSLLYCKKD